MKYFFGIFFVLFLATILLSFITIKVLWSYVILIPLFLLGIRDLLQRQHTVLRIFPIIGHFRFMFEGLRPEIQQYFIESDWDGRPINRLHRSLVYERSKNASASLPFGPRTNVTELGYEWIEHSLNAKDLSLKELSTIIGNKQCQQPYRTSIFNISGMSYGSLSKNAILALNKGAKMAGCCHNTGEGGISQYHLQGGDLVWQIGTGYFGCHDKKGKFSPTQFQEQAVMSAVKMIELKLSQGAEPGRGGFLPKKKLTPEIAQLREVPMGKDVYSPPSHSAFSTPVGLLKFIQQLRELSGGKPVGFKLCIGSPTEFFAICKAMLETKIIPDFITVDGAEGGTGAAPFEFAESVGMPLNDALVFVHNALRGIGLRDQVHLLAGGKIITGFDIITKLALGADGCNSGRAMMLALGCLQALRCQTNNCPSGVTTQKPDRVYGLHVEDKSDRVAKYHQKTIQSVINLLGSMGLNSPSEVTRAYIYRRVSMSEVQRFDEIYPLIAENSLLSEPVPSLYEAAWQNARAAFF